MPFFLNKKKSLPLQAKNKSNLSAELLFCSIVVALIGLFEGQFGFLFLLLSFVIFGYLFIRIILNIKQKESYNTYFLFIGIYGILTLLTHIELIYGRDPTDSYYIHNDAAWSFYAKAVQYCLGLEWMEIFSGTIFNLYFADYPLASLLFGVISKLGQDFSVIDLRLLLRCHVFILAAITTAMISDIQIIRGVTPKKAKRRAIIFGLISYLFITSCIFTRDLHVCFGYTLVAYIILLPKCKYRLVKSLLACLIILGFRPVSGILAFVFIFGYYATKSNIIKFLLIPISLIILIVFFQGNALVEEGLNRVENYGEVAASQTGGVFGMIYSLPFPINQMGMIVYMLLMPLPITKYFYVDGGGGTFLTFPFLLSPYLMSLVFIGGVWLLFNRKGKDQVVLFYMFFAMLVFAVTVFGSPDLRRSFAAIPGVYMAFCIYWDNIPKRVISFCKFQVWPTIFLINLFFFVYLSGR